MWGNIVGITLIGSLLFGIISLVKLFSGKKAGIWGKAARYCIIVFTIAFVVWGAWEIPRYERQQAKINFQLGIQYKACQQYDDALNSFKQVTNLDNETFRLAQIEIHELNMIQSQARLNEAKKQYAMKLYGPALQTLKRSLEYIELEEARNLLPQYEKAATGT